MLKTNEKCILDVIEKDGKFVFVSKRISILPTQPLSIIQQFIWVLFNISTCLTVCVNILTLTNVSERQGELTVHACEN